MKETSALKTYLNQMVEQTTKNYKNELANGNDGDAVFSIGGQTAYIDILRWLEKNEIGYLI